MSTSDPPGQQDDQPATAISAQVHEQQTQGPSSFIFTIPTIHPYDVELSRPAQAVDLDKIFVRHRGAISKFVRAHQSDDTQLLVREWYDEIKESFWRRVKDGFASKIPDDLQNSVFETVCRGHPCVSDPWAGHADYRSMVGSHGKLLRLWEWMDQCTQPKQTWRDTLRAKTVDEDKDVPWISRRDLLAFWVILKKGNAAIDLDLTEDNHAKKWWYYLKDCKLTYQLSEEKFPTPDPYWEGFEQELQQDPIPKELYEKIIKEGQAEGHAATAQVGGGSQESDSESLKEADGQPVSNGDQIMDEICWLHEGNRQLRQVIGQLEHQLEQQHGQAMQAIDLLQQQNVRQEIQITTLRGILIRQGLHASAPDAATGEPEGFRLP